MASLLLPLVVSMAYLWYLRDVADGTISGPAGFWLVVLTAMLAGLAGLEAAIVLASRGVRRWKLRTEGMEEECDG